MVSKNSPTHARQHGLTLVEVLVALVIVTMGTLAISSQVGQTARNTRRIQAKTFATWIAMNKITELRLVEGVPSANRDDGEIEFAGRDWIWESEIKPPSDQVENFMRIEVQVSLADEPDQVIADAIGFVGRGGSGANGRPFDTRIDAGPGGNTPGRPTPGNIEPDSPPGGRLNPRGEGT
ncbi:MAG: type II secretion system minor pseudopilin GspI [Gammaproteobacteria bacterium]